MTNLVNDLVKLGFSTTQQARAIGVSVDVMKNHQQGRYARALEQWQIEKLEQIKELLKQFITAQCAKDFKYGLLQKETTARIN